jgi:hypothetical protein
MKKTPLAFTVALALLSGFALSGCDGGDDGGTTDTTSGTESTSESGTDTSTDTSTDGSTTGGGNTLSCLTPDVNGAAFCADYTGSFWTEAFVMATVCSDMDQVFSTSLCESADALFRCDTKLGEPEEQIGWYFAPAMEANAKAHCEGALMGVFTVL